MQLLRRGAIAITALMVVRLFTVLLAWGFCAGCDQDRAETGVAEAKPASHWFEVRVGERPVRMQLAVTPMEQQRGLMHRRDLGPDEGMLFVYERPQQMSFWMRDTPTPLDIGFFDAGGVLLEVYPMYPFVEQSVSSQSKAVKFPLEMHQGWYARNQVRPGARLDLGAVADALKARGFDPAKYGLSAQAK